MLTCAAAAADCRGPDLRPALHEQVRRILLASEADTEPGAVRDALYEDASATQRWIDEDRTPPSVGPGRSEGATRPRAGRAKAQVRARSEVHVTLV